METTKKLFWKSPEYLLIVSLGIYWVNTSTVLNWFAIVPIGFLVIQIILQNKFIGLLLSFVIFLASLYMCLALASELREFSEFNRQAWTLLLYAGTWLLLSIIVSVVLFIRSLKSFEGQYA